MGPAVVSAFPSSPRRFTAEPAADTERRFCGMIGRSEPLLDVFTRIERVAPWCRTVLVTGQTGTGKDLAARAIHNHSPAHHGHFVTLNCSAIVDTLFESELFGHVRGAFTDAKRDKVGLFEHANGGTIFLDEIGDMPVSTQAKLLRALQQQEVVPVGALTPRKVDVRVIAATNKDLREAVNSHQFREDLFYRLSMIEIEMPSLRERQPDILLLANRFCERWCGNMSRPFLGLDGDVMETLQQYDWPGNVRELENVLGHACVMSADGRIRLADLPAHLIEKRRNGMSLLPAKLPLPQVLSANVADVLEEYELLLVRQALHQSKSNQVLAAKLLKTTRDRLRYKMKKYGLMPAGRATGPTELP